MRPPIADSSPNESYTEAGLSSSRFDHEIIEEGDEESSANFHEESDDDFYLLVV